MTELRWLARTAMLRVRDRSGLALLLAVSVVILSFNFGARLPLTNDERRCDVMAGTSLPRGPWLLPALPDGQPHLAKPPLVVWLMTLASWPTGSVSVRTAVLPSLLEALGVVLVTYWIGRRLFNPNVGLVGGLVTFTTVGVFSLAHSAMPDMALHQRNGRLRGHGIRRLVHLAYRVLCPRWPRIPCSRPCRIASTRHRPRLYDRHRWSLEIDARGVCPGARRAGPPRRPMVDPRGLGRARAIRRRNRVPGSAPLVLREDGVALAGDQPADAAYRRDHASLRRDSAGRDPGGPAGSRPRESQAR